MVLTFLIKFKTKNQQFRIGVILMITVFIKLTKKSDSELIRFLNKSIKTHCILESTFYKLKKIKTFQKHF